MNSTFYNLIFYDEDITQNFIFELCRNKGKNVSSVKYAYILHDKDIIPETMELKKPHYHLWLMFPSPVKSQVLESVLKLVGIDNDSPISHQKTDKNFLAYLTHNTTDSKKLKKEYDAKDIITNVSPDLFNEWYYEAVAYWKKKEKTSAGEKNMLAYSTINDIIETEQIVDMKELLDYLVEHKETELFQFALSKHNSLFYLYKDSSFKENVLKRANSRLFTKNQKKLKALNEEYEQLQAQQDALQEVEDHLSDAEFFATCKTDKDISDFEDEKKEGKKK